MGSTKRGGESGSSSSNLSKDLFRFAGRFERLPVFIVDFAPAAPFIPANFTSVGSSRNSAGEVKERRDELKGNRLVDQHHRNFSSDWIKEFLIGADEAGIDGFGDGFAGAIFQRAGFDLFIQARDQLGLRNGNGLVRFGAAKNIEKVVHYFLVFSAATMAAV